MRITIGSCVNNDPSAIALKVTCYKRVDAREVRNPLLTVNYTAIYVCNHSIISTRRFYEHSDNALSFMAVTLSSHTISRDFTLLDSWSLMTLHNLTLRSSRRTDKDRWLRAG
jgi:hypothetical protein